ncbi:MAG: carbonic anhydrase [Planctomycetota bacterium]
MIDDPDDPLERLRAGNQRFMRNEGKTGRVDPARIWSLAEKQQPFACVVACSDSRVPVEFVFDQGLGDLFVVRTAGNTAGEHEISSVNYAVSVLGVSLVLVLGHTGCGVVRAALQGGALEEQYGPEIAALLGEVRAAHPAGNGSASSGRTITEADVDRVAACHAMDVARTMVEVSPPIGERVREGRCRVVAAVYETGVGRVNFLDEI